MTYGRALNTAHGNNPSGAAVSHLAELVRGYFLPSRSEGALIRPFGPPSPQGEKGRVRSALEPHSDRNAMRALEAAH